VTVAALALVSGCSAQEQQASTELPSASSTSAEPTPELPPLGPGDFPVPDEARVQDEAGAEAFLRYYIDLINRQIRILEGEPLRDLAPECNECLRIARDLDEAAEAGRTYRGSDIAIDSDFGTAEVEEGFNLAFFAQIASGALLEASGSPVPGTESEVQRLASAAIVTWSNERQSWLVKALNFG
jgi:hypothetical protein